MHRALWLRAPSLKGMEHCSLPLSKLCCMLSKQSCTSTPCCSRQPVDGNYGLLVLEAWCQRRSWRGKGSSMHN